MQCLRNNPRGLSFSSLPTGPAATASHSLSNPVPSGLIGLSGVPNSFSKVWPIDSRCDWLIESGSRPSVFNLNSGGGDQEQPKRKRKQNARAGRGERGEGRGERK